MSTDLNLLGINPQVVQVRARFRKAVGRNANPAEPGNTATK